ncbi:hypothetical protein MesoLj113a_35020 [Mesorhizobium sp. 113-1-2]|uniref:hypothetical protein n=1 Tax=Mesorhizobium sp. 113-1-2 TaxID=2744515 RepID=UPI0019296A44|nr:hypothetical protein [Mesorhizobium sp. 113-1-2]BCG72344.1 hypothetical protein MesoLj113a_35020 [Mesorhizobium sp. 113-1-2]
MVHVIPLSIAQRRLDTGNAPQYPQGSPIGGAMQGFGDHLSAVAERYQQMKDQQEAFDAELARRRFDAQIAQAEDEVTANAPADGAGLHDAMYGQVDPYNGRVVKTGLFDKLFAAALPGMPESQRAAFAGQKEALRQTGALRMAARQLQRRDDYELAEWTKVDTMSTSAIAQSDPNDTANFEAIRQSGSDLIAKIGNPLARQAAEAAWRTNTAKALVQAMIAQDPKRAAEMLGAAQGRTKDDAVVGGSSASDSANAAAAKGDRVGTHTPDEAVAQAFDGSDSTTPENKTAIPLDAITYLKPDDVAALKDQANSATAAQLIGARARVLLAEQNAPAVIAATGKYPEEEPTAQDFVNIYGAEDGPQHFDLFRTTAGVAKSFFDMYRAPNQAIHAELRDFEPGPDGSPEERERYEVRAGAAQLILGARDADPASSVGQLFPGQAPDWSKVSTPQDFQAAVTWTRAAQQQMGFDRKLPLPWAVADQEAKQYIDPSAPFSKRFARASSIVLAIRDPGVRKATAEQFSLAAEAQWRARAAQDPNMTPELLEAQLTALREGLAWIGEHPAQAQYSTMSSLQQFGMAFGDIGRTMAKGATAGGADALVAGMAPSESGESYDERLGREQAETEDAEDRAGLAGWVAEGLGAGLSGYGLTKGLFGLLGRAGIGVAESGGTGLAARTGVGGVAGGAYGGAYAYNTGRSVPWGGVSGALGGAAGNVLAEGLSAVGRLVVARLAGRSVNAQSAANPEASAPPVSNGVPDPPTIEGGANSAGTSEATVGHDLHLYYMPEWDAAQRAAADLKVKILTEADTVVSRAERLFKKARKRYIAAGNHVPAGSHVDHRVDLQLGGGDILENMGPLDASVNTSLGSQIKNKIKLLPHGTKINKVTIGDRGVRDIPKKLSGG